MNRSRFCPVTCPACAGEGGEVIESYAGYDGYYGPEIREDWRICEACGGESVLRRVDALAWLIHERWDLEPAPVPAPALTLMDPPSARRRVAPLRATFVEAA